MNGASRESGITCIHTGQVISNPVSLDVQILVHNYIVWAIGSISQWDIVLAIANIASEILFLWPLPTTASCLAVQMDQILLHSCSLSSPAFFFSLKRVSCVRVHQQSKWLTKKANKKRRSKKIGAKDETNPQMHSAYLYIKGKKVIEIIKQTTNKEQESAGQSTVHRVFKKTK